MTGDPLDLEAIRARADAASDGPWYHGGDPGVSRQMFESHELIVSPTYPLIEFEPSDQGVADAEFVAHARTDVPALLAEVDRLQALLDAGGDPEEPHLIEFRGDGWTIQHPLRCRPQLFDCPVNRVAETEVRQPPVYGVFEVSLSEAGDCLVIGTRRGGAA